MCGCCDMKLFFLLLIAVDIKHNQWSCQFFNPSEIQVHLWPTKLQHRYNVILSTNIFFSL